MENDFQSQIAEAIDAGALFNEKNKERQATELRKLLIVAGLNVEEDLANPEIMSTIMRVLEDFDPNAGNIEDKQDEAMFEA